MAKANKVSDEVAKQAMDIANGRKKPGQTKEQTRLIAQGIQQGIAQYKKEAKRKQREMNKVKKKQQVATAVPQAQTEVIIKQAKLPWILLLASYSAFIIYWFISA